MKELNFENLFIKLNKEIKRTSWRQVYKTTRIILIDQDTDYIIDSTYSVYNTIWNNLTDSAVTR